MSFSVHGLAVSRGIAIGRAVIVASSRIDVAHYFVKPDQVESEIQRLRQARLQGGLSAREDHAIQQALALAQEGQHSREVQRWAVHEPQYQAAVIGGQRLDLVRFDGATGSAPDCAGRQRPDGEI